MIKFENSDVIGWDHAIRGMRNPMNSWDKSDSGWYYREPPMNSKMVQFGSGDSDYYLGPNDMALMIKLSCAGSVHAKFRRMINLYVDIIAPLYWWKEFDTYKVGTVANSCSTMHKIQAKEFELSDFSCEHLISDWVGTNNDAFLSTPCQCENDSEAVFSPMDILNHTIKILNINREEFLKTKDKKFWWQMIQLLPTSYNQKRTVMINYEVLAGIYKYRQNHKLDEWCEFCRWIEDLPFSEIITGGREEKL